MTNYPLKERSETVKKEIRRVEALRKIEIAEKKVCTLFGKIGVSQGLPHQCFINISFTLKNTLLGS